MALAWLTGYCILPGQAQRFTKPLNLPKLDRKPIHFGFLLGANAMPMGIRPVANPGMVDSVYRIELRPQGGFTMGLLGNVKIHEFINFRFLPSLSFGSRKFIYSIRETISDTSVAYYDVQKSVESTYLELPLLLRFKSARLNNVRVYVDTGIKYSFDLSSKAGTDDKGGNLLKLRRHDLSYDLGVGLDFYLQYFKFSPSLRVSWGFLNVKYPENHMYSSSIERLYSRMVLLTFYFEGSL
ncbi:MAG: PorT family protein [Flavobacteriales bacterium]|nr:PorT family protein [Flavobacteriales bacterium]